LEAAQLPQPAEVNGVKQKPIEGVSMLYSFDDPKAKGTCPIQYFEMFGNRALYKDGWIATGAPFGRLPVAVDGRFHGRLRLMTRGNLYNLAEDLAKRNDLSGQYPDN
jgi:arylsulfatase